MSKVKVVLFLFALLLLAANSGFAASYAVGSCLPKLQSFPTIYQAMNTIPNGSTLMICPGTYYEQVIVSKVVNIKGVVSGGTSRVVIKPGATMYPITDCLSSHTIYPLVMVGTGPVNISNITVDGNASLSADTGFYFYCVAEGTLSQVTVRNLYGNAVRMQGSIGYPVVLQNSNLHDITGIGVLTEGKVAATIKNNFVSAGSGILWNSTGGSVTGNYITALGGEQGGTGIGVFSPGTFSGNTIEDVGNGLQIGTASGLNFVNNKIYKADIAINPVIPELNPGANIVKSNTIAGSNTAFEFYCIPETMSGNIISDTSVGMDQLASGVSAVNTFANVDAVQTNACP